MRILCLVIISYLLIIPPYSNLAQRNINSSKSEIKDSRRKFFSDSYPKPIKRGNGKGRDVNNRVRKPKVKVDDGSTKKITIRLPRKNKKNSERQFNFPVKKKKLKHKKLKIIEPIFYDEGIVYEVYPPAHWHCGEEFIEDIKIEILDFPYSKFPLRFLSAETIYLHSVLDTNQNGDEELLDIYELNFSVKVRYENYYDTFGILLKYYDETEQLEIFNEDEDILVEDKIYSFSKDIVIKHSGYLNLRIGYYDSFNGKFHPEKFRLNKTDKLTFVLHPQKQLIYNFE